MEWRLVPRGKMFRKIGSVLNVVPPKKIFLKLIEPDHLIWLPAIVHCIVGIDAWSPMTCCERDFFFPNLQYRGVA